MQISLMLMDSNDITKMVFSLTCPEGFCVRDLYIALNDTGKVILQYRKNTFLEFQKDTFIFPLL